jgi:hypothetical protein
VTVTTLAAAAVDDDLHVAVVRVVRGEAVVQLRSELFGDDAVDHGYASTSGQ